MAILSQRSISCWPLIPVETFIPLPYTHMFRSSLYFPLSPQHTQHLKQSNSANNISLINFPSPACSKTLSATDIISTTIYSYLLHAFCYVIRPEVEPSSGNPRFKWDIFPQWHRAAKKLFRPEVKSSSGNPRFKWDILPQWHRAAKKLFRPEVKSSSGNPCFKWDIFPQWQRAAKKLRSPQLIYRICMEIWTLIQTRFKSTSKISYEYVHTLKPSASADQYRENILSLRWSQWPRSLRRRSAAARLLEFGFESRRGHGCLSLGSDVCCQVEVSTTSWSFVQRSPTDCGASSYVI